MEKYFQRKTSVFASVLLTVLYLDAIGAQEQDSFQQRYIGCYYNPSSQKNNWTAVILNSNVMTIETCMNSCRQTITTYAILQDGRNCLCGDDIEVSFPDITCNVSCSGNGSQVCGGNRATMIAYVVYAVCPVGYYGTGCDQACHCKQQIPCYRVSGVCPNGCESNWTLANCSMEANVSDRYIGCYSDYVYNRQITPFLKEFPTLNTIEYCSNVCASNNFTYAGLQYSYQCFCGESYGLQQQVCTKPCDGNSNQICGDENANSVYSVCPRGSFGKDCIVHCQCVNDKICRYDNGYCGPTCKPGWSGGSCSVRSCSDNNGACSENESCVTVFLKFSAVTRCQCSTGYRRKRLWDKCTDINECDLDICDNSSTNCTNAIGNFSCMCRTGYTRINKTSCEDTDECLKSPPICKLNREICINTVGSYKCNCSQGYTRGVNNTCNDINECALKSDNCSRTTEECNNTIGGFVCTCKTGFKARNGSISSSCEDIDECISSPCGASMICSNTEGSFHCKCTPGFTINNSVCEDINECALQLDNCSRKTEECNNTNGSFICSCKTGFKTTNESVTNSCADVDECISSPCDVSAMCSNTQGSFHCKCKSGFTLVNSVCTETSNAGTIAGAVVGSILGLALIVAALLLVLYFLRRRQPEKLVEQLEELPSSSRENLLQDRVLSIFAEGPNAYTEIGAATGSALNTLYNKLSDPDGIKQEFQSVDLKVKDFCAIGTREDVKKKNRFINIIPYESNRVMLSLASDEDTSQYINASYVQGYNNETKFIAAQGPRSETLEDFWRMIFENRIHLIVMITKLMENQKNKCEKYWSELGHPVVYGEITVTLKSEDSWPDYTVRCICCSKNSETVELEQLHYLSWPDHGVPTDIKGFLRFHHLVRQRMKPEKYTLVHCSAGAGRTGAFIAIDYLIEQQKTENDVQMLECLKRLRGQRSHMIQNLAQYVFVHNALVLAFEIGDTVVSNATFLSKYKQYLTKDLTTGISTLEKQFQFLEKVNMDPLETAKYRVQSNVVAQNKINDMNAVFVQSWKLKDAYIATQPGDPFTHLWELRREKSCAAIVFLDPTLNSAASFVPTKDNPKSLKDCTLICESVTKEEYGSRYTISEFKDAEDSTYANVSSSDIYQNTGSTSARTTFTVLHIPEFCGKGSDDAIRLMSLYNVVSNLRPKTSEAPVMVVSSDCSLSGFCLAAFNAFEMMKQEGMIDIYEIVLNIRKSKTELFNSASSYIDLHNVVERYIVVSTA